MTAVDYEGMNKEAFVQQPMDGRYNLVATFPSPEAAGTALQELRRRGFSDADVHIMGSSADAVVGGVGMTREDRKVMRSTARYAVYGVVGGAALGAIIGVILMAIPAFQSAIGVHPGTGAYLLAAAFGALIGSVLGVSGGIWGLDARRAGSQTYRGEIAEGPTIVGVHVEDEERTRMATSALNACGAASVQALGRNDKIVV